jgi:hypothetical protein
MMSVTQGVLRGLGICALASGVFVIFAFSTTESVFRCDGQIVGERQPATLFMTLTEYRWWFRLWNESDGIVVIEAPKEGLPQQSYAAIKSVGNSMRRISENFGKNSSGLHGVFYKVSRYLALDTPRGHFEGTCVSMR